MTDDKLNRISEFVSNVRLCLMQNPDMIDSFSAEEVKDNPFAIKVTITLSSIYSQDQILFTLLIEPIIENGKKWADEEMYYALLSELSRDFDEENKLVSE